MTKNSSFSEEKLHFSPLKTHAKLSNRPISIEELLLGKFDFFPQKSTFSARNICLEQYQEEYAKFVNETEEVGRDSGGEMPQAPQIARERRNWSPDQLKALSNLMSFGANELNEFSTNEEIKSAFRRLAKQFHPDMIQNKSEQMIRESAMQFMQIHRSYKTLIATCDI